MKIKSGTNVLSAKQMEASKTNLQKNKKTFLSLS
jgi:hypothetical protein